MVSTLVICWTALLWCSRHCRVVAQTDPCVNSPCSEGATCVSLTNVLRPLYCSCPLGRTGDLCQHVGAPEGNNNTATLHIDYSIPSSGQPCDVLPDNTTLALRNRVSNETSLCDWSTSCSNLIITESATTDCDSYRIDVVITDVGSTVVGTDGRQRSFDEYFDESNPDLSSLFRVWVPTLTNHVNYSSVLVHTESSCRPGFVNIQGMCALRYEITAKVGLTAYQGTSTQILNSFIQATFDSWVSDFTVACSVDYTKVFGSIASVTFHTSADTGEYYGLVKAVIYSDVATFTSSHIVINGCEKPLSWSSAAVPVVIVSKGYVCEDGRPLTSVADVASCASADEQTSSTISTTTTSSSNKILTTVNAASTPPSAAVTARTVDVRTTSEQFTTGTVHRQASSEQFTTGTVDRQTSSEQFTTGTVDRQTSSEQFTTGTVDRQTSSEQFTIGTVDRQTSSGEFTTRTVDRQTSSGEFTTRTVDRQTSSEQLTTGTVHRQTSSEQFTTGTVDRQTSSGEFTTRTVDRQTSSDELTSGLQTTPATTTLGLHGMQSSTMANPSPPPPPPTAATTLGVPTSAPGATDVETMVTVDLQYALVVVCTSREEDQVKQTLWVQVRQLREEWPAMCPDANCSNAHVTAACQGPNSRLVLAVVTLDKLPETLTSLSTGVTSTPQNMLVMEAVKADGAFDMPESVGASLQKDAARVTKVTSCRLGLQMFGGVCDCGEGTFREVQDGSVQCHKCPLGTYQDKPRKFSCNPCPAGTSTSDTGADEQSDCTGSPSHVSPALIGSILGGLLGLVAISVMAFVVFKLWRSEKNGGMLRSVTLRPDSEHDYSGLVKGKATDHFPLTRRTHPTDRFTYYKETDEEIYASIKDDVMNDDYLTPQPRYVRPPTRSSNIYNIIVDDAEKTEHLNPTLPKTAGVNAAPALPDRNLSPVTLENGKADGPFPGTPENDKAGRCLSPTAAANTGRCPPPVSPNAPASGDYMSTISPGREDERADDTDTSVISEEPGDDDPSHSLPTEGTSGDYLSPVSPGISTGGPPPLTSSEGPASDDYLSPISPVEEKTGENDTTSDSEDTDGYLSPVSDN